MSNLDELKLDELYSDALDERSKECGGYRLNFGVYYTPKF